MCPAEGSSWAAKLSPECVRRSQPQGSEGLASKILATLLRLRPSDAVSSGSLRVPDVFPRILWERPSLRLRPPAAQTRISPGHTDSSPFHNGSARNWDRF